MSRARELSRLGNINVLSGDDVNSEVGIASTVPRSTLDVRGEMKVGTAIQAGTAGVLTATSFSGALGGNIVAAACTFTTGTFTGNVTIGGTLTYEDVTNVDALGIITARAGVNVSGGQLLVGSGVTIGNAGVATFSGTSDVHLLDSVKLNLGDGSDLSLYHNGSNGYSYIEDTGSGRLVVKTSYFEIDNEAGNEAILEGIADGAVKAYYNGSLKLETTSGGIQVTGNDGVTIVGAQDNSADLFFNADGGDDNDDKWYIGAYAGGPFKLLNYASGSWETNIEANGNGNVELYFNDSKKLETTNDGTVTTGISTVDGLRLGDNEYISVGAGGTGDLQLSHNGSHSYINHGGTGDLWIRNTQTNGDIYIVPSDSNGAFVVQSTTGEVIIQGSTNGDVELYYNNSKKFETTNDGVVITGITTSDGLDMGDDEAIKLGVSDDLVIKHDGSDNIINSMTQNDLWIKHGSDVQAAFKADGAVEAYYDASKKFETTNDGVVVTGIVTTSAGVAYTGLLRESFAKTDGRLSANTNIDLEKGMVHYFTTAENTTSTPNIRWNSSISLNNKMNINDAITVTIISAAAAAGYSAQMTIDGGGISEQWVGGDAPDEGGANGYDIYTYNILKTADATFFVIAHVVNAT